jgi:GntR family transcriptional regulator
MEFKEQKPIYRQIADYLLELILTETLSAGDRIQSVRELAKEVQVNPNTVMRTYSFLSEANIIYNQRGIGYFVAEQALDLSRNLKKVEFVKEKLPGLMKTIQLLGIGLDELEGLYKHSGEYNSKIID